MKKMITRGTIAAAVLGANQALAGGLWLNDFGDFSAGRAAAGASAGTDEPASIIYNPASAGRFDANELFLSAGAFFPTSEFEVEESSPLVGNGDGGDAGEIAPGLAMAYVHDTNSDKWGLGISLGGLAGAGLDYDDDWVGRYQNTEVTLLIMALAPAISYNITDKFAVGIAPQVYYADLEMELRLPNVVNPGGPDLDAELNGDDTGFSFAAGMTYDFNDDTRIGIAYQSELDIEFGGELKLKSGNPDFPVSRAANSDTELTMAQLVRASVHHDLNDVFAIDVTLGWDDWSAMDNVFVSVDGVGGNGLVKNWEDTYHYGAGFQYAVDESWDLTAGIAYDTNPVDASDRTADLPIDRQVRYNVGLRKEISDSMEVGGILNYTDLGSARIRGDFWSGEYDSNSLFSLAVFLNWRL